MYVTSVSQGSNHLFMHRASSHVVVVRAAAALRHSPVDELLGRLDRAALAMYAILRVDDQLGDAVGLTSCEQHTLC